MPRKVALIIGNSDYSRKPLKQCVEDANNVEKKLKNLDFKVTYEQNLNFRQMHETIDRFISQIIGSDYVIFYFSGHGMQWGDQNYLIGCDNTTINNAVLQRHINVQEKLNEMVKQNPSAIIFLLDCCREYCTSQQIQGGAVGMNTNVLKQIMKTAQTLIVFACGAGETVSGNGIFTKHLIAHLKESNLDIESFILQVAADVAEETNSKQVLHRVSTLTKKFYFFYSLKN